MADQQPTTGFDPYAPPESAVRDVVEPSRRRALARPWKRLAAWLIDSILNAALLIPLLMLPLLGADLEGVLLLVVPALGLLVLGFWGLQLALLYSNGWTLGKRVLSIRIVNRDGTRAALARILVLRVFVGGILPRLVPIAGLLYFFADSLLVFREDRRCIHDLIAGTIVVEA